MLMKTRKPILMLAVFGLVCTLFLALELPALAADETLTQDADGCYLIEDEADLTAFAAMVNGGDSFEGKTVKLTADIIANENVLTADKKLNGDGSGFAEWTPIGNSAAQFMGTFEGGGHIVSGLYFNNNKTDYVGLFGYISDGAIQNVGVVDSYFYGRNYVGGVCGENFGGAITNCYSTSMVAGVNYVGGVCGQNRGGVTACYNTGTVSGSNSSSSAGGICGNNYGGITNCYNAAAVKGTGKNIGGISGLNSGSSEITDCYNAAAVSGGSICGYNFSGTITNCYYDSEKSSGGDDTDGVMKKTTAEFADLSNLTGFSSTLWINSVLGRPVLRAIPEAGTGSGTPDDPYLINNAADLFCFADIINGANGAAKNTQACAELTADIVVNENVLNPDGTLNEAAKDGFVVWTPIGNDGNYSDNAFAGTFNGNGHTVSGLYLDNSEQSYIGMFGYCKGTIKNVGLVDSYFNGRDWVGGICGSLWSGDSIIGCYNAATVSGSEYVGGICGWNHNTIANCYNIGVVTGEINRGGICGGNYKTVANCYNAGKVNGGGICGMTINGSVATNCYNNSDACAAAGGGVNKTSAEFVSGEVAYLLQQGQEEAAQIWGQTLGGKNSDQSPVLAAFVPNEKKTAKQIYKVSFMWKNGADAYSEYAEAYANNGGTAVLPEVSENDEYRLIKWSRTQAADGAEFTADTAVTADTTVYAVGQEKYGEVDGADKSIAAVYGRELTKPLTAYVGYITATSAIGNFNYAVASASNGDADVTASGWFRTDGDILKVSAATPAATYTLDIKATEKEPQIAPFSLTNAGVEPVEFALTVTVAKADPTVSAPTGLSGKSGKLLRDVALPDGWVWKDPETVLENEGEYEFAATYIPSDTANYNTVDMDLTVAVKANEPNPQTQGGSSSSTYTVTFNADNGEPNTTVKVAKNTALKEPTAPVKAGYSFGGWYADSELTQKYDFSSNVTKSFTLYAKWLEKSDISQDNPFVDVKSDDWFWEPVLQAFNDGLMLGVTSVEFAPNENITRGMFVTVLYRMEGEPQAAADNAFVDVPANEYYTDAIAWASANGIVNGYSAEQYAPNQGITREQMAAIIYRYAKFKAVDLSVEGALTYPDSAGITDYAKDAVIWNSENGIIRGNKDMTFAPLAKATRAEAAAVFTRMEKLF